MALSFYIVVTQNKNNRIAVFWTEQVSQQDGIIAIKSLLPHNEK